MATPSWKLSIPHYRPEPQQCCAGNPIQAARGGCAFVIQHVEAISDGEGSQQPPAVLHVGCAPSSLDMQQFFGILLFYLNYINSPNSHLYNTVLALRLLDWILYTLCALLYLRF